MTPISRITIDEAEKRRPQTKGRPLGKIPTLRLHTIDNENPFYVKKQSHTSRGPPSTIEVTALLGRLRETPGRKFGG